jgi:hypothetical protein
MGFNIQRINATAINEWLARVHYLHRPVIKSKMLAHGVYQNKALIGGLLWTTPHFTKKRDLFGMPNTLDKWEVLMLARFYLIPDSNLIASTVLSDSIGKAGNSKSNRKRGWRLQQDWVLENPPRYPEKPYVPRLLISWSDEGLEAVESCAKCGQRHEGKHKGIIYQASGWELWDVSGSSGTSTGRSRWCEEDKHVANGGRKICWIMRLAENRRAWRSGQPTVKQQSLFEITV